MLLAVASPFLFGLFQANPCYGTEDITLILPEVKACLVQVKLGITLTLNILKAQLKILKLIEDLTKLLQNVREKLASTLETFLLFRL